MSPAQSASVNASTTSSPDSRDAYTLDDGEGGEESPMEVDETTDNLPPVAAVSAAMAHAELYGHGASAGSNEHGRVGDQHSDSATREYLSSLPGSPTSDREPPALPLVDWNDMENVFQHFPVTERERARRVQQVGMFPSTVFQEYMKIYLMTLYPGQPDMMWDYPAFWTQNERHGFTVFWDIIIRGMYLRNWGTFVEQLEQWFTHEDLREKQPGPCMPWTDD